MNTISKTIAAYLFITIHACNKSAFCQSILTWKNEPLLGKVKKVESSGYDIPSAHYGDYKIKNHSAFHFDTSGKLLYKQIYNDFGAPYLSNQITYDNAGRIIETRQTNTSSTKTNSIKFKFNTAGEITESQSYENDTPVHPTIQYTYNALKQIIVERYSYPSGELSFTDSFTYDNFGRQIIRKSVNSTGSIMIFKSYYNEQGNVTVLDRLNKDGNLEARTRYNYDNYDSKGNWQKKTGYKNDKLFTETTRKITYYD